MEEVQYRGGEDGPEDPGCEEPEAAGGGAPHGRQRLDELHGSLQHAVPLQRDPHHRHENLPQNQRYAFECFVDLLIY